MTHPNEIYKRAGLPLDCPRTGDFAEVTHSCCQNERGLLLRVTGPPHWCASWCSHCQFKIRDWIVEVRPIAENARLRWIKSNPPPWFFPVTWLRRWAPGQVGLRGE